jgi:hypothetical protein
MQTVSYISDALILQTVQRVKGVPELSCMLNTGGCIIIVGWRLHNDDAI